MCLGIRSEIGRNKFDEPKIHFQRLRDPVKHYFSKGMRVRRDNQDGFFVFVF